jgi:hypothetical protein
MLNVETCVFTKSTIPTLKAQNSTVFIPFVRQIHACTLCRKITGNAHAWTLLLQQMLLFDTRRSGTSFLRLFGEK